MRHRRSRIGIPGKPDRARMMARNLVTSILLYESIRTTRKRAKAVQPMVDRLIALAKRSSKREAIRSLMQVVTDDNACRKTLEVFVPRYAHRPSGFTRIVPVGLRKGDGAQLVDLVMMDQVSGQQAASSGKRAKKVSTPAST
ncbi:MAG: 50S ribosomal protein L17 [Candidatus Peregrinibacteria bacterium Gr01-1014_25]|nr:MAG: 50S ribosomal protein L17 [Candidatus Peregrinibacteria bacterium Gr01-1014_25]